MIKKDCGDIKKENMTSFMLHTYIAWFHVQELNLDEINNSIEV